MDASGVAGGLIVHVGDDPGITAGLLVNNRSIVHGLYGAGVQEAREALAAKGLYGRITLERWEGGRLPYADNLVNLLIADGGQTEISREEVLRVLVPRGVAMIGGEKIVKPVPGDIGDWTHYLYDASGCGTTKDRKVAPPNSMQWVADPKHARSHETDSTHSALVSSDGRLFFIQDDGIVGITDTRLPQTWSLNARDAFNGIELWKVPITDWGWRAWKEKTIEGAITQDKPWVGNRIRSPGGLMRRLVGAGDCVYVTLGYTAPVSELDARTGKTLRVFEGTETTSEIIHHGDKLILVVGNNAVTGELEPRTIGEDPAWVVCLSLRDGRILWKKSVDAISVWSLSAWKDRVFYSDRSSVRCLDIESGDETWNARTGNNKLTLVTPKSRLAVYDNVLFFLRGSKLLALSVENGKTLWEKSTFGWGLGLSELHISSGLIWSVDKAEGYDPQTGKVERKLDKPDWLITPGHHLRCFQGRSTERFFMTAKRGTEYWDTAGGDEFLKMDWARSGCKLGLLPANGIVYFTPHPCRCYQGLTTRGFNALLQREIEQVRQPAGRLGKGPAYSQVGGQTLEISKTEWPMYRQDPARSGSVDTQVSDKLKEKWTIALGGKLTQPVKVGDTVYVSSKDRNTVYALDAETGEEKWRCVVNGPMSAPPTIYKGLVLVGAHDGCVYCLRAHNGALVWKFHAAPAERRIIAFEKLESTWPVLGGVLVLDDVAYFAAGRHTHLDGGIFMYALDPSTGDVVHYKNHLTTKEDVATGGNTYDAPGSHSDLLLTDGEHIYCQKMVLDKQLNEKSPGKIRSRGERTWKRHLFSTGGLLDDSTWNRTYWMHAAIWPGSSFSKDVPKRGQLIVFDDTTTYSLRYYSSWFAYSPTYQPETTGYLLYADDNGNEPRPNLSRSKAPVWRQWVPIRVRGMVKAADKIFLAGPPDVLDPEDPLAAFQGRKGGLLRAASAADGEKLNEVEIPSPPVFDGLIAADGKLLMSDMDGKVACFE